MFLIWFCNGQIVLWYSVTEQNVLRVNASNVSTVYTQTRDLSLRILSVPLFYQSKFIVEQIIDNDLTCITCIAVLNVLLHLIKYTCFVNVFAYNGICVHPIVSLLCFVLLS